MMVRELADYAIADSLAQKADMQRAMILIIAVTRRDWISPGQALSSPDAKADGAARLERRRRCMCWNGAATLAGRTQ